ncbi:MAG: LTA synthase family protein [Eubacteriales bacterium]|nr:LTA synthase family protein [Eubacteriales bacterium]
MKKYFRRFWLAYPLLVMKMFVFYWQTDRLDMMDVYEVPVLTVFFLIGLFEVCCLGKGRVGRWAFYFCYTFVTLLMFADAAYSSYFGKYISVNQLYQISSLGQIAGDGNVVGAAVSPGCMWTLLDYPFLLLFFRIRQESWKEESGQKKKYKRWAFRLTLSGGMAVVMVCLWLYYGWNPQHLRSVQKVNHIEFFTYHTNDILVNVVGKMKRKEVDKEVIAKSMEENVPKSSGEAYRGVAKGRNLILIQTESLNQFVIGRNYDGKEITPNLNRLLEEDTLYFNHFYSNTGVGNTSDAEFSVLNGLYPNDERECYRLYVDNTFHGLPWMLREKGYEALAFHGYTKTFWNREEAYKNQGFQHFYSEEELDVTEVSGFGLTDKEMFRQAVDILKEKKNPYFSFMITLTNHIPYELDEKLASLKLRPEDEGTTFGRYLQTVRYTDEAFGELIERLKKEGMYENTMIVIYGDHQGMNMETPSVKTRMTQFLGKEYHFDEMLKVPLLVHIPGLGEARTISTVGGQVDVMPTIANLMELDMKQPYVFGHDLLNTDEGFVAQISYIGKGSFLSEDGHLLFSLGKDGTVENGTLWDVRSGKKMSGRRSLCEAGSARALALLEVCKEVLDYNLIADYVNH